jgi:hypothetical protein
MSVPQVGADVMASYAAVSSERGILRLLARAIRLSRKKRQRLDAVGVRGGGWTFPVGFLRVFMMLIVADVQVVGAALSEVCRSCEDTERRACRLDQDLARCLIERDEATDRLAKCTVELDQARGELEGIGRKAFWAAKAGSDS